MCRPCLTGPLGQNLGGTRRHEGIVIVQVRLQLSCLRNIPHLMDTLEQCQAGVPRRLPLLLRDPCKCGDERPNSFSRVGRSL